ncbi:glycosyltransferase family A protein [Phenylobacterium sp.]|uniref:glycosyltransferase family 2 protein n=1 Tax=Phenylobacterium sp. TaxID=1871053 RepID=UPI0028118D03|nr:glycosyltransferase family A protein [Phenylobacterium sp.]
MGVMTAPARRQPQVSSLIIVVIATAGRPRQVEDSLALLRLQSRRPDLVVVSATASSDLPQHMDQLRARLPFTTELLFGSKGLTRQRNRALERVQALAANDVSRGGVVFFDDDFVPREDWLENAAAEFSARPGCVGLTGVLLADGANGPGYDVAQASQMIRSGEAVLRGPRARAGAVRALYGCNMALCGEVAVRVRFDEQLPLYGWLEDEDVSGQLRKLGRLFRSDRLVGVHLGAKSGRVSGRDYGYSQIANPLYLVRKGTYPVSSAAMLMARNLASNLVKAPFPEPYVDRAARLRGNLLAITDLARGRLHPCGAAELR